MCSSERYLYRSIVRDLTKPLIDAYRQMIQLQLPTAETDLLPAALPVTKRHRRHTRLLFHSANLNTVMPCTHNFDMHTLPPTTFA